MIVISIDNNKMTKQEKAKKETKKESVKDLKKESVKETKKESVKEVKKESVKDKNESEKSNDSDWDTSDWDEDWEENEPIDKPVKEEEKEEEVEPVDVDKLVFTKVKDLKEGMENVNVIVTVDFLGETYGKGFGEAPYSIAYVKDETGEIKMTFWGDDLQKAKPGTKVRVIGAVVSTYRLQLQLNPDRKRGVDFI